MYCQLYLILDGPYEDPVLRNRGANQNQRLKYQKTNYKELKKYFHHAGLH